MLPMRIIKGHPTSPTDIEGPFSLQKLPAGATVVMVTKSEEGRNEFSGALPSGDRLCVVFDSTCEGISMSESVLSGANS